MTEYRTKTGKILTDEDIEKLADEAERGYDIKELKPVTEEERKELRKHTRGGE